MKDIFPPADNFKVLEGGTHNIGGVFVSLLRDTHDDGSQAYALDFSGVDEKAIEFVRETILEQMTMKAFDARHSINPATKRLTFAREKNGRGVAMHVEGEEFGSIQLNGILSELAQRYPASDLLQYAMREQSAKSIQRRDAEDFSTRNAAVRKLLGTPESLQEMITGQFENAGHDIYFGGRVNFDLDSEVGQKLMRDIAETLLAHVAEKLPRPAANSILANGRNRDVGGL